MQKDSFDHLLSTLYAVDGDPGDFTPFLHALGRTMCSHVLAIQSFDAHTGDIQTDSAVGIDDSWAETYSRVASENLWYSRGTPWLLAQGVCDDALMDCAREMRRTRFHADFLRPTDIEHGMALRLSAEPGATMSVMTVNRSARSGSFTDGERLLAKRLLPHLQNARTLHARLQQLAAGQQICQATLDQMPEGIFHLAADGSVVFANEAGLLLEMAANLVRRRNGRLLPTHPADNLALQRALQDMATQASGGIHHLQLHGPDGLPAGLMTLCPAPPPGSAWSAQRVAAIAFVKRLDQPREPIASRLQVAWELTRAECQLARLLLQGFSLEDAAGRLGVSKNTVRTQVRSMYEKTGTHRQGELVALLHRAI